MAGETDLATMLATLTVERRPDPVTLVHLPSPVPLGDGVAALITEAEGTTAVVTLVEAERRGWPVDFVAAWLTIKAHSSLEAVGLTAAFSAALGAASIPCNVFAGFYHDHILVPIDRASDAIECLEGLRSR